MNKGQWAFKPKKNKKLLRVNARTFHRMNKEKCYVMNNVAKPWYGNRALTVNIGRS